MSGPAHPGAKVGTDERAAGLALLPVAATLDYYALPDALQAEPLLQFMPQAIGYAAFGLWALCNRSLSRHVGLATSNIRSGAMLGLVIGGVLGCLNTVVILHLVPSLGFDIRFLKETPHAHIPLFVMVPWGICLIAFVVELNFRGFLLGRLAALESMAWPSRVAKRLCPLALITSSLVFAFDPFMVATFRHLHWIAVWDGVVWGLLWLFTRNLYGAIVAHAVEVIIVYSAVRWVLMR